MRLSENEYAILQQRRGEVLEPKRRARKSQRDVADALSVRIHETYGPVFHEVRDTFGYLWTWHEKRISIGLDDWICASEPEMIEMAGWIDIDFSTDGMQDKNSLDHAMKVVAEAVKKQDID